MSLRSGLVTEEELVPALAAQSANCQEEDPQELQEAGDGLQETGEESCKEEDPVVEVVQEPDAEKEPSRNTEEGLASESAAPSAPAQESGQRAEDGNEGSLQNRFSLQEEAISQQMAPQHQRMGHFYRPTTFQRARYLSLVIPFLSSWHRNNTCPHGCYSLGRHDRSLC